VRDDVRSLPGSPQRLAIVDGVIPAFVEYQQTKVEKGGRARNRSRMALAFIDPRSGVTLGEKVPLRGALSGNRVGIDLAIHGEFAILGTSSDMRALRVERSRLDNEGGL